MFLFSLESETFLQIFTIYLIINNSCFHFSSLSISKLFYGLVLPLRLIALNTIAMSSLCPPVSTLLLPIVVLCVLCHVFYCTKCLNYGSSVNCVYILTYLWRQKISHCLSQSFVGRVCRSLCFSLVLHGESW